MVLSTLLHELAHVGSISDISQACFAFAFAFVRLAVIAGICRFVQAGCFWLCSDALRSCWRIAALMADRSLLMVSFRPVGMSHSSHKELHVRLRPSVEVNRMGPTLLPVHLSLHPFILAQPRLTKRSLSELGNSRTLVAERRYEGLLSRRRRLRGPRLECSVRRTISAPHAEHRREHRRRNALERNDLNRHAAIAALWRVAYEVAEQQLDLGFRVRRDVDDSRDTGSNDQAGALVTRVCGGVQRGATERCSSTRRSTDRGHLGVDDAAELNQIGNPRAVQRSIPRDRGVDECHVIEPGGPSDNQPLDLRRRSASWITSRLPMSLVSTLNLKSR